jgi:hypothetical protein
MNRIRWNRNEVNVDDIFAYNIAYDVMNDMRIMSHNPLVSANNESIGPYGKMTLLQN